MTSSSSRTWFSAEVAEVIEVGVWAKHSALINKWRETIVMLVLVPGIFILIWWRLDDVHRDTATETPMSFPNDVRSWIGWCFGWGALITYNYPRVDLLIERFRTKHVDDLAFWTFGALFLQNATQITSIVLASQEPSYLKAQTPWIVGTSVPMVLEAIMGVLFYLYGGKNKRPEVPEDEKKATPLGNDTGKQQTVEERNRQQAGREQQLKRQRSQQARHEREQRIQRAARHWDSTTEDDDSGGNESSDVTFPLNYTIRRPYRREGSTRPRRAVTVRPGNMARALRAARRGEELSDWESEEESMTEEEDHPRWDYARRSKIPVRVREPLAHSEPQNQSRGRKTSGRDQPPLRRSTQNRPRAGYGQTEAESRKTRTMKRYYTVPGDESL